MDGVLRGKFMVNPKLFGDTGAEQLDTSVKREILERRKVGWIRILQCYLVNFTFFFSPQTFSFDICSGWDIQDTVYSKELLISNKANGYRDVTAVIDLSSFRRIPWENNVPFFLVFFLDPETNTPLSVDPRGVLQVVTERAVQAGYDCFSGVEYEVRMQVIARNHLLLNDG